MSEQSDETFEQGGAKSLEQHLRSMDSEELLGIAGEIRGMTAHPGWAVLLDLLERKAAATDRALQKGILSVFSAGHGLRDQAPYLRAAGVANGLRQPVRVVDKVLSLAKTVEAELGITRDGEKQ